jgi:hypothetical protein
LIFHARLRALFGELSSFGPNIISAGHQKRLMASCSIWRWASLPCASAMQASKP